jgi:hypothetical protein
MSRHSPSVAAKAPRLNCYTLQPSILTPAERSFLRALDAIDHTGHRLCAKVRLADIFGIRSGLAPSEQQTALNRITSKHVDFLFVQLDTGAPVLALELDDSSHERLGRRERDAFVDQVFADGGLPLVHIPTSRNYAANEIKRRIAEAWPKDRAISINGQT